MVKVTQKKLFTMANNYYIVIIANKYSCAAKYGIGRKREKRRKEKIRRGKRDGAREREGRCNTICKVLHRFLNVEISKEREKKRKRSGVRTEERFFNCRDSKGGAGM
jgi:hypothetical protein